MSDTLDKQPSEDRLYDMDFGPRLSVGETLTGAPTMVEETVNQTDGTLTSTAELTMGTPTVSGEIAQVRISGGVDGVLYKVTFRNAGTSNANLVEAEGFFARALQHEIDHLDGKLFIDFISPLKRQLMRGALKRLKREGEQWDKENLTVR